MKKVLITSPWPTEINIYLDYVPRKGETIFLRGVKYIVIDIYYNMDDKKIKILTDTK